MFALALNNPNGFVMLRCECGQCKLTSHDIYSFEQGNDYVVIKDNTSITCDKCGRTQSSNDNPKIIDEMKVPVCELRHLVRCPVCNSANVEKASIVKKCASYTVMGVFSPYVRSDFYCKSCGKHF